ncbi:hypothetical protein [Streptomyces sp. NPDC058385]|uniref:hypothetical protein n=1 Tax=Streptomyces sp. NPDC058385 TaxID=3346473 RepID=UPI00366999E2
MRVLRLRGANGTLLECPACRLKCLRAAVGPDGGCPRCGHSDLIRLDSLRGSRPAVSPSAQESPAEDR